MHDIRTVKCPKCGAEVQVFDTDLRASCPQCGTSFEVPSVLDEKLARQAEEAMKKSVAEIREEHDLNSSTDADEHGKSRKILRILLTIIVLAAALCILMMAAVSQTVN